MRSAPALLAASRLVAAWFGASALFGQLFFSQLSVAGLALGAVGIVSAALGERKAARRSSSTATVLLLCTVAGVIGLSFSAFVYYSQFNVPGNSFGWYLKLPYLAALIFIAFSASSASDRMYESPSHNGV